MERLTVHGATSQRDIDRLMELSDENQFGRNKAYYKLQEYEDLGFTPEEIAIMAKFYKEQTSVESVTANLKIVKSLIELDKYKKLEAAGKLIKLPCAVGDEFWAIAYMDQKIVHVKCTGYSIYFDTKTKKTNESYIWIDSIEYLRDYWKVPFDNFKEQCFHTKAEAEAALERNKYEE